MILEREENSDEEPLTQKTKIFGVLLGVCGAIGQGVGLVISKYGIVDLASNPDVPLNPISATFIRMLAAGIFLWVGIILAGKLPTLLKSRKDKKGIPGKRDFFS